MAPVEAVAAVEASEDTEAVAAVEAVEEVKRVVVKEGQGTYSWSFTKDDDKDDEGNQKVVCVYKGTFLDGKKHGLGRMTYPNGDCYHGLWEAGKRHGDGTYAYANGDFYSGGWDNDKKHGEGSYEYAKDGSQMIGTWKEGKYTEGKWVYPNGSYQGSFKEGKFVGKGTFEFGHKVMIETGQWIETTADIDGEEVKTAYWRSSKCPEGEAPKAPEPVEDDE